MKYPLENLTDKDFEDLVALICEQILGMGTVIFSVGKDGGKDGKFQGKANKFPSEVAPWDGKIIIQAKHTQRTNASCSDSAFKRILKNDVFPAVKKLSDNNVGMAHCPTSNMRLGSGIAPVFEMKNTSVRIGLGVDGSSSNDTGNFLMEIRNALLLQRVRYGAGALTPREALEIATIGGAKVLRMDREVGSIEKGKAADIIGFNLDRLEFAGGLSDPVASLVLCDAKQVDFSMINGEIVVENGHFVRLNEADFISKQNNISKRILGY